MTRQSVTDDTARLAKLGLLATRQGELFRRVKEGTLDPDWVAGELQRIIEGKLGDANTQLAEWVKLYGELGVQLDPTAVRIPERRSGFDRLVMVAQGVTPQWAYDECAKLFRCWKWINRNLNDIVESDRNGRNGPYAVWVRDRVEADEELKNLSADMLEERKISGITLEERLVYELKYFMETGGKHLDIATITLCTGSRYSDGGVPCVGWCGIYGELDVDGYGSGDHGASLRARAAVS